MYPPNGHDMDHIVDGIWIGGYKMLNATNVLNANGIKFIVNCALEFITEDPHLINWQELQRNGIEVHNTMWDDTLEQTIFPSASLETAVKKMDDVLRGGKPILVNCQMGKSRSTSCVIAYLIARRGYTYDEALAACKRGRPRCQPNQNFERQLRQLEASLREYNMNNTPPMSPTSPVSQPQSPHSPHRGNLPPMLRQVNPTSPTYMPSSPQAAAASPRNMPQSPQGYAASPHRSLSPQRGAGGATSPYAPLPPSPLERFKANNNSTPSSPSYGARNGNGFNGMNNSSNGYGPSSPTSYNSSSGFNNTYGGMNGSGYSNAYNSMYGSNTNLPNPHANGKYGTPYGNSNGYGLQSPYAAGGIGYSPYSKAGDNGNSNGNSNGMWNNHGRSGSEMTSPLRRRLSI